MLKYATFVEHITSRNSLMIYRGQSRTAATSKLECFVIIANDLKPLTIITKCSILDVAAAIDPPLIYIIDKLEIIVFI